MTIKQFIFSVLITCTSISIYAQTFPGGVTGTEVWYISNWEHIGANTFSNYSATDIEIRNCSEDYDKHLFNFNPSILTEKLCLNYIAPLENSTGRNIFFVGEPTDMEKSISHIGTLWRTDMPNSVLTDSIIRNYYDFNTKNIYTRSLLTTYTSYTNAQINFYHLNNYNIDKKFKSYGQEGETTFYIGKPTQIDPDQSYDDYYFTGNFPEFISFTRELSANERNRVESYLALKYGLTLNRSTSYLSSKNIVFWDATNNKFFPFRIFGFGKDDISGLLQLQSESTHLQDHLISAIDAIVETNMEKQEQVDILNNHFLVFGDNDGKPNLIKENKHKIKFWDKVWLAQRTGKEVEKYSIHFKLYLSEELADILQSNPEEKIWLLQDKYIGNDEVSEFDSEDIDYYSGDINWDTKTAYFKDVYFDTDLSIYDQFTFGVGPEMIVQAQIKGCKKDKIEVVLDITGGKPKYTIKVVSEQGSFEDLTTNSTYSFLAESDTIYSITVIDEQGLEAEVEVTVEPWNFSVDLGADQFLTETQQEITLDAGQGIDDPNAYYEWYLNGVLLPDNESTLTVAEIGIYEVVVTSEDHSCSVSDEIKISYSNFSATLSTIEGCDEAYNSLTIDISEGIAPFTTSLTSIDDNTTNYAHSGSTTITGFDYGSYTVTVTDSTGETFVDNIVVSEPPSELGIDIYAQLESVVDTYGGFYDYSNPDLPFFYFEGNTSFTIDASQGAVNPNLNYEWYMNGVALGVNSPQITFEPGFDCYFGDEQTPVYTVIASDNYANCFVSQSFNTRGLCPEDDPRSVTKGSLNPTNVTALKLDTKVYPNPSKPNSNFTYEVFASESFSGTIEVFAITGAKLYSIEVKEKTSYVLPLSLQTSGVYIIRTITSLGIVKTNRVIIK